MITPTRYDREKDLDDFIREALDAGHRVTIERGGDALGFAIAVDGDVLVDGLAWESFGMPLSRYGIDRSEELLVDELLTRRERRRLRSRRERLTQPEHVAAEGLDVALPSSNTAQGGRP